MGRHSAPEDDGDLLVAPVEEPAARPQPRPRHAAPAAEFDTDVIEPELVERDADRVPSNVVDADVVEDDPPVAGAVAQSAPSRPAPGPALDVAQTEAPTEAPKRERPSRGDLRLLRSSSALRARCAAALVLPFVLYTIVLVVLTRLDAYLLWIWIPAILAGVLFGAQLDAAARAARTTE